MSLFLSLLICFLNLAEARNPQKHFYVLGGGGEPKGETTIFDNDLKLTSKFINNSDWQTIVSFDGGHAKTESIIREKMPNAKNAGHFVEANYEKIITDLTNKLGPNGELKAGDQIMISIDTHGGRKNKEKTHAVSLAYGAAQNLNTLEGSRTVSLDSLQGLIDLAEKKGVKLAIVDMSCYSGNLHNLKSKNSCLISATGRDQYGYAGTVDLFLFSMTNTFSGKFYDLLKKGKNLEDVFLAARTKGGTPDFPMISTEEGKAVDELLYKMLSPYLNFNNKYSTNLDKFYASRAETFAEQICDLNNNHENFLKFLDQYSGFTSIAETAAINEFQALKQALEEYRNYQQKYEESLKGKFKADEDIKAILNRDYAAEKSLWKDYSPTTFIELNFDRTIKMYQELYNEANNEYGRNLWKKSLEDAKRQKQIIAELKEKISPNTKDLLKTRDDVFANSGVSYSYASRVATEAKKVYDNFYRKNRKETSNPCRDFVL